MPQKIIRAARRCERRVPMEVPVLTIRQWERNATVSFVSRSGEFRSKARVAYCQSLRGGFAIGVEFVEPQGRWVVESAN